MASKGKNGSGHGGGGNSRGDGCDHDHDHDDHSASGRHPSGLTRNENLVWDALSGAEDPLKAYEILDILKEKGVRAPMTVYRALEGLEAKGYIHKLEGLNSFVLCKHEGPHEVQVFMVCETCASATEIELEGIEAILRPVLRRATFQLKTARLEARGQCVNCAA
jgi:Fur family zinc uptake transcriptional regulator